MINHNLEIIKITERLQEHCPCFDCNDGADIQAYLNTFFQVLGRLLCWADKDCATILKAPKQEILPLENYEVCNCQAVFEFKPYWYKAFDPSTLKLFVHKRQGIERTVCEIPPSRYNYDFVDNTVLVDISEIVDPCCCCYCPCDCPSTYQLVATYEAGYTAETLPECVIEALCHFFNVFIAYQNNCGSLDDCSKMDRLAVGSVLKSKSVDYLIRTWEVDQNSLELTYTKLLHRWEMQTLGMLSLCRPDNMSNWFVMSKDRKCETGGKKCV